MEIEEIKIEGNSKQDKREDDNLYNTKEAYFINGTLTQNGITAEKKENGSIEFNGTATNDTYFKLDIRNLEDGRYYFYNFNTTEQSYETYYMLVQGKKGETYYNARGYETETFEKNSEIYEEDFSCIFTIKKGYEAKRLEVYPMISKVEQTKYKPYGTSPSEENPSEIRSVGKNGKIEIVKTNKNIIEFKKEDWERFFFNNDGTENYFYQTDQSITDKKYYPCKENEEMTLSLKIRKNCRICRGQILFVDEEKKPISVYNSFYDNTYKAGEKAVKTFTVPKRAKYLRVNFRWIRIEENNTYININMKEEFYEYVEELMLEKGKKATEYEEHKGERYIIPVQEPMYKGDYLGEDGEHHKMKVREIDGTEDWRIYPNREEDFLRNPQSFYIAGGIKEMKATNFNYVQANQMSNWSLCSRYPARQIARGIYEGIECGGNNIYMCYKKFKEYTIEELKQYLAEQYSKGTPLKVIYELEEEKIIPYTEEQKKAIEEIKKARTYKNETIIYSTDEVAPVIEVKYRKDIETMIKNITKAIIEIGGV